MSRRRPTSVLVIAIINMVAGTLAVLCGLCGLGQAVLSQSLANVRQGAGTVNQADLTAYMNKQIPGYSFFEGGYAVLLLFLGIAAIVAGIGLLRMHRWAR